MSRPFMTPEEMMQVRANKKWSQEDLARFLGCSPRTIYNYEKGLTKIPRGDQLALDRFLKKPAHA